MKRNMQFIGVIILAFAIFAECNSISDSNSINSDQLNSSSIDESNASTAKSKFKDEDDNSIPDEGEVVTGTYKSLYAYDTENYYWDLGDGRVSTSEGIESVDNLDQSTITNCYYKVQYRGTFENDPFMDTGWIRNNINCKGYDDNGNYNYLIVHETDHRYTGGNPDTAIWGDWEYFVYAIGGQGNVVRPENHVGS